jgi:hypothetical protein
VARQRNNEEMTWMLIAYLFGLLYVAVNRNKLAKSVSLRAAWVWFALVPLSQFVFALFRAGNIRSTTDLALVEIWADGIGWLFLGISLLCLTGMFPQQEPHNARPGAPSSGRPAKPFGDSETSDRPRSGS